MITQSPDDIKDQNKELVRRFYLMAFAQHDLDQATRMMSPDYVLHDPTLKAGSLGGIDAWKKIQGSYIQVIPNHKLTIMDQIAEGDKVVTRWIAEGTQKKPLPEVKATNGSFVVTGITITRVQDGLIAEEWQDWDSQGLYQQIGAEPDFRRTA